MIVAAAYVLIAIVVWFAEGFLFIRFFAFGPGQAAVAAAFYVGVAAVVLRALFSRAGEDSGDDHARWRILALAPMLVVVVGSFVSLPVMLLILAVGRAV